MDRPSTSEVSIESWSPDHRLGREFEAVIEEQGQTRWVTFSADWHLSSHILLAIADEGVVGFLRFVVQEIGPEYDRQPVRIDGVSLTEAKILAFAVDPDHQRRGIGSRLQHTAIGEAQRMGCFQVRSFSAGSNAANHALKLKLGFSVTPDPRKNDPDGLQFVRSLSNKVRK